jgi:hypothetical protein
MKAGIKYCGGCNPAYRREKVEEILRRAFPEVHFFYISSGDLEDPRRLDLIDVVDVIVCISGCKRGCAVESVESSIASRNGGTSVTIMSIDGEREKEDIIAEFERCLKS